MAKRNALNLMYRCRLDSDRHNVRCSRRGRGNRTRGHRRPFRALLHRASDFIDNHRRDFLVKMWTRADLRADDTRPDVISTDAATTVATPSEGHACSTTMRVPKHTRAVMQANEVVVPRIAVTSSPPRMPPLLSTALTKVFSKIRSSKVVIRIRMCGRLLHHHLR